MEISAAGHPKASLGKRLLSNASQQRRRRGCSHSGIGQLGRCEKSLTLSAADCARPCRHVLRLGAGQRCAGCSMADCRSCDGRPRPAATPARTAGTPPHAPATEVEFAVAADSSIDVFGPLQHSSVIGRFAHHVTEHRELGLAAMHPYGHRAKIAPPRPSLVVCLRHQPPDSMLTRSHSGTLHVDFATLTPLLSATAPER